MCCLSIELLDHFYLLRGLCRKQSGYPYLTCNFTVSVQIILMIILIWCAVCPVSAQIFVSQSDSMHLLCRVRSMSSHIARIWCAACTLGILKCSLCSQPWCPVCRVSIQTVGISCAVCSVTTQMCGLSARYIEPKCVACAVSYQIVRTWCARGLYSEHWNNSHLMCGLRR
jgi:hypothetical protein